MEPEENVKKELKESVKITIKDNSYTVKLPNVGEMIDLEMRKSRYVMDNNYVSGVIAETLAKAMATFSVLIPKLKEDLNVESYEKMGLVDSKEIMRAYRKEFLPWWNEWMEEVGTGFEED